jgi:hypothetical protein
MILYQALLGKYTAKLPRMPKIGRAAGPCTNIDGNNKARLTERVTWLDTCVGRILRKHLKNHPPQMFYVSLALPLSHFGFLLELAGS